VCGGQESGVRHRRWAAWRKGESGEWKENEELSTTAPLPWRWCVNVEKEKSRKKSSKSKCGCRLSFQHGGVACGAGVGLSGRHRTSSSAAWWRRGVTWLAGVVRHILWLTWRHNHRTGGGAYRSAAGCRRRRSAASAGAVTLIALNRTGMAAGGASTEKIEKKAGASAASYGGMSRRVGIGIGVSWLRRASRRRRLA